MKTLLQFWKEELEKRTTHHIYHEDDVKHDVGVIIDVLKDLLEYLDEREV